MLRAGSASPRHRYSIIGRPVERVGNRLPNPHIFQDRIAQVESQISKPRPAATLDR